MYVITDATVFDGERLLAKQHVFIEGEHIVDVSPQADKYPVEKKIDALGHILAPGFIDLQVNGGNGILLNTARTADDIKTLAQAHVQQGSTSLLLTCISDCEENTLRVLHLVEEAASKHIPGVWGIHLEGPFLSAHKAGIHDKNYFSMEGSSEQTLCKALMRSPLSARLITLAPECVEGEIIQKFSKQGVCVFAGHTMATAAQLRAAKSCGLRGVTHLFNACSPLQSREPGVVGAALLEDTLWCSIIVDGYHVDFDVFRLAFRAKPLQKFILVSDAMPSVGTSCAEFLLGTERIFVRNGRLENEQGTLAGAHLTVHQALQNLITHKLVSIEEGLAMSSTNAATCLGFSKTKGRVLPGFDADLVLLDKDNLDIKHVFLKGQMVHATPV